MQTQKVLNFTHRLPPKTLLYLEIGVRKVQEKKKQKIPQLFTLQKRIAPRRKGK